MNKLYASILPLLLIITGANHLLAQAPKIAYPNASISAITGTPISPVKIINTGGTVPQMFYGRTSTFAGAGYASSANGPGITASFNNPSDLAFDAAGILYVADTKNNIIRKILPDATVTTIAGSATANGYKDDISGYFALFNAPTAIAADSLGNLYIADNGNNRIRKIDKNNTVTTFAGSGTTGSTDGTGTAASFYYPQGLTTDLAGNLYVTDYKNYLIRKVSPTGVVKTLTGSTQFLSGSQVDGAPGTSRFAFPSGITADAAGNLYVTDDNLIRKVLPDGTVSTIAGKIGHNGTVDGPVNTTAYLDNLQNIAIDRAGNIFFTQYNNTIRQLTPSGNIITIAGGTNGKTNGIGSAAQFDSPLGLAIDGNGNLFVADSKNNQIRKVETRGYAISPALPTGLSIDSTGTITGTPTAPMAATTYQVTAYNQAGSSTTSITLTIAAPPVIKYFTPTQANASNTVQITGNFFAGTTAVSFGGVPAASFTVDATGTMITATLAPNTTSGNVIVTTNTGTIAAPGFVFHTAPVISYTTPQTLTAGAPITPITVTKSGGAFPQGMYGKVSVVAGSGYYGFDNGSATAATFANPIGVATDRAGNIYVADANNNVIRKITPAGVVSTYAGSGSAGLVDGPSAGAMFKYPSSIAIDADGNLYITDTGNQRIRKISTTGTVSTMPNNLTAIPYGITSTPGGTLYVANTYNNNIVKMSPNGDSEIFAGQVNGLPSGGIGDTGTNTSFQTPYGITFDIYSGNIYIQEKTRLKKMTEAAKVSILTGVPEDGIGVAADGLGNIYSTNSGKNFIGQLNGVDLKVFAGKVNNGDPQDNYFGVSHGIDNDAILSKRMAITYDNNGSLIITDQDHSQIKKVSLTGYYLDKDLPNGLVFDYPTGTISGTPLVSIPATEYTISAYNAGAVGSTKITLTISLGAQTITFPSVAAKTYGDVDFSPASSNNTASPIVYTSSNTNVISVVNNQLHIVGAGTAIIKANQPASTNFSAATEVSQTITVKPAELTVGVYPSIRAFGQADPQFYLTYTGFVNGDDETKLTKQPTASTTTTLTTVAGDYPLNISGGVATNYSFKYVPGIMTVFPVPVITPAGSLSFKIGGSVVLNASPATGGYTYTWYKGTDVIPGATAASYTATESGYYTVSINKTNYTTFSAGVIVDAAFFLPTTNFKVTLTGSSCRGSNNGSINITAVQKLNYVAEIVGGTVNSKLPFTDKLDITSLAPGNYNICISVTGQNFLQCFYVSVTEPKDLSIYTAVNKNANQLTLTLDGGSQYNITLNGNTYTTSASNITLPLAAGNNKLSVSTDKLCQGVVDKLIILSNKIIPYPDPFQNTLFVNIGEDMVKRTVVTIHSAVDGKLVYKNTFNNRSGALELDVTKLNNGLYVLVLALDNNADMVFKILKK